MKKFLLCVVCTITVIAIVFSFLPSVIEIFMPDYNELVGNKSYDQKIQGTYLIKKSAEKKDNVVIYGSSELRTDYISTHPSNFFKNNRRGFQVNLVGRGSCQSIIHAMSIAASGDSLENSPVVLITSPQSYVDGGITPDMFFANFSKQQYIRIIYDRSVPKNIKVRFSSRLCKMFERYDKEFGKLSGYDDIRMLSSAVSKGNFFSDTVKILTAPYFLFERTLCDSKDKVKSAEIINELKGLNVNTEIEEIDYSAELEKAEKVAETETTNNEFGMRNSDYKKNVGSRLSAFKDKDKNLSYEKSVEYDDLELLLDVCKLKGIKPLFVSVPLHGQWSDYTGFTAERREAYYNKVKETVSKYDADFLDLSGYEYEKYFLCDTMHLGWKGWVKVNEEIDRFHNENYR